MLPKVPVSVIDITVPSTKAVTKFSRFRVADEKILLIAKESGETSDMLTAIKQVISNCVQDVLFDITKLSITDIEYLFLKLHAASVSNIINIAIFDPEDSKRYDLEVDLNTVEVDDSKRKSPTVKITDDISVVLVYPPASLYGDKDIDESKDPQFETIVRCISKIFQGDTIYETKNVSKEEVTKWVSELSFDAYERIKAFFDNRPTLSHTVTYKNSLDKERTYTLTTLSDFFTL